MGRTRTTMTRPVELEDGTEDPRYLEYDGDLQDDDQRCEHGKFIGSWWGPDILCGYCEDGISQKELMQGELKHTERELKNFGALVFGLTPGGVSLDRTLGGIDWKSDLGKALLKTFTDFGDKIRTQKAQVAKLEERE